VASGPLVLKVAQSRHSILTLLVVVLVNAPLVTDPVISALVSRLRAKVEMKDRILQAHMLVEWLDFEEELFDKGRLMGEDSNDVWDWDGNCQGRPQA